MDDLHITLKCGIHHGYMKDVTKFVALLNREQAVVELCCIYSSKFFYITMLMMFCTKSEGGGVLLVVLGGSFSREWNFGLEQKEQNVWKVLGESDKRVGIGRNSNTRGE